jgi:hypothetical protein
MNRQDRHECESSTPDEFFTSPTPQDRLLSRERDFGKQMQAAPITNSPIVEFSSPTIHLPARHFGWIVDEAGHETRFMRARGPELLSQTVILARLSRNALQLRQRHSINLPAMNTEAGHAGHVL